MLSLAQIRQISYLSDTILYTEAVAFIQRLIKQEGCHPLATSQVTGLLYIAKTTHYREVLHYIQRQRDRDWPWSKRDIKVFYTELEKYFTIMSNKRLESEFHLLVKGATNLETKQQRDELMAALAPEFLQHLLAENNLLLPKETRPRR